MYVGRQVQGEEIIKKEGVIGSVSQVAVLDGASREGLTEKWHLKGGDGVVNHQNLN